MLVEHCYAYRQVEAQRLAAEAAKPVEAKTRVLDRWNSAGYLRFQLRSEPRNFERDPTVYTMVVL